MYNINSCNLLISVTTTIMAASSSIAAAETHNANCDDGTSIQEQVDRAAAGDTIVIQGTCKESITIPAHKPGLVLDGQGSATIENAGQTGIRVLANGVAIRNLTVQGGGVGIGISHGSASIDNSTVRLAEHIGISIQANGSAIITNSTIENNQRTGIEATTGGYAEVGRMTGPGGSMQGNLIQNNGIYPGKPPYPFSTGVKAKRNAHITVLGNTITGNTGGGVGVRENSFGLISANVIENNGAAAPKFIGGGFGISVKEHSIVNLWRDTSDSLVNHPNTTRPGSKNSGYGFHCDGLSSYEGGFFTTYPDGSEADGLMGTEGALGIADSCNGTFYTRRPGPGPG